MTGIEWGGLIFFILVLGVMINTGEPIVLLYGIFTVSTLTALFMWFNVLVLGNEEYNTDFLHMLSWGFVVITFFMALFSLIEEKEWRKTYEEQD